MKSDPFSKQREPMKGKDGMGKVGCQHNEHKALESNLKAVAKHLDRQDDLGMYNVEDTRP